MPTELIPTETLLGKEHSSDFAGIVASGTGRAVGLVLNHCAKVSSLATTAAHDPPAAPERAREKPVRTSRMQAATLVLQQAAPDHQQISRPASDAKIAGTRLRSCFWSAIKNRFLTECMFITAGYRTPIARTDVRT